MKLGIKVAPGNAWKHDIEATHPALIEFWYNASKPADYQEIFEYVKGKSIDVGLHYWGALPNNLLTNISYPDPQISGPSLALVRATIDDAARNNCAYVNIHPDLYSLLEVNFQTMDIRVASEPADSIQMRQSFRQNVLELNDYAKSKGVVLTVETVPMRDTPTWNPDRDRTQVIDIHQMSVDDLIDLATQGVHIANDICHTACNLISNDRKAVWEFLYQKTKVLAPQTKLIHLGFLVPPYNGVDFHDSLDNPIFETDQAIPNKNKMTQLLQLFKNRDDVWILTEPKEDHVKNFLLAQKILENAAR